MDVRQRMWRLFIRASVVLGIVALLLLSCAPASRPGTREGTGGDAALAPGSPTTLRLGLIAGSEPTQGITLFTAGGVGTLEHTLALHGWLTVYDAQSNLQPHLAQTVPTIENGDWQVFPDGRMEVTWRLRPDVKWHDGAPLTADDFAFGVQLLQDDSIPVERDRSSRLIARAVTPDPYTLVMSWTEPYMLANASGLGGLTAVPRHLLGDFYQGGDRNAFVNSPYWTTQFVGVGPYRMGEWESGSYLEALAFDQYFLGRPKIDRLIFRYFGDVNPLMVSMLAGDVDMTPLGAMKAEQLVSIKQAWEPSGIGSALVIVAGTRNYRYQFRDPNAPWARDVRVRQALIHLLDRPTIVDTLVYGLSKPADTLAGTDSAVYRLLEQRGLARYPYDPTRAQRLLSEAGWMFGTDGTYRSASGEPFTVEVRTSNKTDNVKEGQAVAAQWKATGLNATPFAFQDNAVNREELRNLSAGVFGWPLKDEPTSLQGFVTTQIPSERTRWRGNNYGGYSNPTFDRLFDQYLTTLDLSSRQSLLADLLKHEADEVLSIHLYYDIATNTMAFRKGVRGPGPVAIIQPVNAWNIHTWELD